MEPAPAIDFEAGEQVAADERDGSEDQPVKQPKQHTNGKAKRPKKVRCEHCSTSRKAVVCEADPKRPGWVKCPQCNWRYKPATRLLTHGQRLQSTRSARQ